MQEIVFELGYRGWECLPGTVMIQPSELRIARDVVAFGAMQDDVCILAVQG